MKNTFKNKTILVTGGAGSIGSEIVRKLIKHKPKQIRILDIRETELVDMQRGLNSHQDINFFIGDVRDKERLNLAMKNVDIVFHTAALKHVPACEYNPFEAVKTNVGGTQNVIDTALANNVEKVINISTDKVTNTINTMGATKLLAERLITSANNYKGTKRTVFSSVRFGNVLNSRGSMIELFRTQLKKKEPLTVTCPEMTRFIMSIPQAVNLVLKTAELSKGGEIFILKMPVFKLDDLIKTLIEELSPKYGIEPKNVKIKEIGLRAGEKMYEDLMTEEEARSTIETEHYLIIQPEINISHFKKQKNKYKKTQKKRYSSKQSKILSKEELKEILYKAKIFN
ncbi:polysaccharide biosynthesis protein [archaeon]|nr:polysaccharide biosynthesis protein [archaeon]